MVMIAVDDERLALEGILSAINKVVSEEETHGFRSPDEALQFVREHVVDVAFLDIEMRQMNGITLAKKLKALYPKINIIFTTGYSEYSKSAFEIHASGYVAKPVTPDKIRFELNELRNPIPKKPEKKLRVKAFGNFEAYANDKTLVFHYSKSKELLAFLIDRNGSLCTSSQMEAVLWEDEKVGKHKSYLKNARADLVATLDKAGCGEVLERQRGALRIIPEKVDCDYFDYLNQKLSGINAYMGEYMAQYSWAEATHGFLEER